MLTYLQDLQGRDEATPEVPQRLEPLAGRCLVSFQLLL